MDVPSRGSKRSVNTFSRNILTKYLVAQELIHQQIVYSNVGKVSEFQIFVTVRKIISCFIVSHSVQTVDIPIQRDNITETTIVRIQKDTSKPVHGNSTENFSFVKNLLKEVATNLYGRTNLSMKGAEAAMDDVKTILDLSFSFIKQEVEDFSKSLPEEHQTVLNRILSLSFARILHEMEPFKTEQRITTNLEKSGLLKLPTRKVFDEKVVQVEESFKTIKSEAILLPIEHQIKTFLQKPNVLSTILLHQQKKNLCPEGIIEHFLNGKLWKKIRTKYAGDDVIPIFIYNDDFNPDDGLGPHGKGNKTSGFYYSFPTLQSEYASSLDSIFVAMLANTEEMHASGVDTVLGILVDALKFLEEGIHVNGKKIIIAPVLLLGDNLALNVNLGKHQLLLHIFKLGVDHQNLVQFYGLI